MEDLGTDKGKKLDHRIFRSDTKLTPDEINNLLGIKNVLPKKAPPSKTKQVTESGGQMLKLAVITVVLASFALLGSMYQMQIGPFYDSEAIASTEP